jgi:hypothetical protein
VGNSTTASKYDWVRTVLGVIAGPPVRPAVSDSEFAKAWPAARAAWQSAIETVDGQIGNLQKALRDSGDEDYREIAEIGLNAVTGNYKVRLMAAMREVDGGGPRDKLARLVADFADHIATDERVMAVDENPLKVAVSVRKTLGPALERMCDLLA